MAVDIPSLAVVCTGVFDEFMERNGLHEIAQSDLPDDRLARSFQKGDLPFEILGDLRALVNQVQTPLAVRSSSREDAKKSPSPASGTKMVPNNRLIPTLVSATQKPSFVYASVFEHERLSHRYRPSRRG
jgi:hypothetical protein